MRAFSTIKSTFWTMGSGKRLRGDPEAQVLALYLMTCSQGTMCGIFSVALPTIAHETGIPLEVIPSVLKKIRDIVVYDTTEELCWIPNSSRVQIGKMTSKDKRRPGLIRELNQFGSHPFVGEFFRLYSEEFGLEPSELAFREVMSSVPVCPMQECEMGDAGTQHPPSTSTLTSTSTSTSTSLDQGSGQDHARETPDPDELPRTDPPESAAKTKRRPPLSHFAPDEFEPSDAHKQKATELGVNLTEELSAFRLYEFKTAKSDWNRAFFGWLQRSKKYGGNGPPQRRGKTPVQPNGTNPLRWAQPALLHDERADDEF